MKHANKLNQFHSYETINRSQLAKIFGGSEGVQEPGDGEGTCEERGKACDTSKKINCCSGLVCADYKCYLGTI
ncbi:MAG: hypothetical protein IBJ16_04885 [Chitinophagaceae bacterium]|nr:hypothetical protein [Chitinophagaceae bacterium]